MHVMRCLARRGLGETKQVDTWLWNEEVRLSISRNNNNNNGYF